MNDSCEETKHLASQVQALIKQIEEYKQKLEAKGAQDPGQALTDQIEADTKTQPEQDMPKGKGDEGIDWAQQVLCLEVARPFYHSDPMLTCSSLAHLARRS